MDASMVVGQILAFHCGQNSSGNSFRAGLAVFDHLGHFEQGQLFDRQFFAAILFCLQIGDRVSSRPAGPSKPAASHCHSRQPRVANFGQSRCRAVFPPGPPGLNIARIGWDVAILTIA